MFKLLPKLKSYCTTPLREVLSSYKGWQTNASLVCSKLGLISQSTIRRYWEKWYFIRFDSKLNAEKTLQENHDPKMKSKQVIVKKIVMYTNKFQKQPLLHYRKNIQFFCSKSSIILMRLHVMNKYEGVLFKVRALKISSKLLNEFLFLNFWCVFK